MNLTFLIVLLYTDKDCSSWLGGSHRKGQFSDANSNRQRKPRQKLTFEQTKSTNRGDTGNEQTRRFTKPNTNQNDSVKQKERAKRAKHKSQKRKKEKPTNFQGANSAFPKERHSAGKP